MYYGSDATPATASTPTDVNIAVNDAPVEDESVTTTTSSVDILTTALPKEEPTTSTSIVDTVPTAVSCAAIKSVVFEKKS